MSTSNALLTRPEADRWIKRRAKLFEAGEYPDKGVTVTADHLSALASSFSTPVPLLIEHAASPLEMGFLTEVFSEGAELFGTVSLTPEADAMVESSGARSLSLGLAPDLSAIREVSLVRNPRIESARLFGGEVCFEGRLERVEGGGPRSEGLVVGSFEELAQPSVEASSPSNLGPRPSDLDQGWSALRSAQVDREVQDLMRSGRICPAQSSFAKALLLTEDTIEFDGASAPVRQIALEFLRCQPRTHLFSEFAPAPADHSQHLLLPEEAEFYRRHFPEVSLDEIAKRKK